MDISDITEKFIETRCTDLETLWTDRNTRMDEYEKLYLLDIWETTEEPDKKRITAPICWTTVEAFRPLLLTRPPVISVPPSEVKAVVEQRAGMIENYLYGVWYQAHVMEALDKAEWHASCLGEGALRCVYDPNVVDGELPLVIQALDPRNLYANESGRFGQDLEVVHALDRKRRVIQNEWGIELSNERPVDEADIADWLDEEIEYIDYWRVDRNEVEEAVEREEEDLPAVSRLEQIAQRFRNLVAGPGEGEEPEEAKEPEKRKVRRLQVTNAVVADGEWVKKPVVIPGYSRLPFIRYPGIATGLEGENGSLSVLFPITGGVGGAGSKGIAAGMAELINMRQEIIEVYANASIITDSKVLDKLDLTLGAVNQIEQGKTWSFLIPPGPNPAVSEQIAMLEQLVEDASVSGSMKGRYVGELSGLALTAVNNPVLMRIAHRQQIRERAYEELNKLILSLTEEYAPAEGWYVWGPNARQSNRATETQLRPDEIDGYWRNRVKLTASLPKDEAGEIMSMSNLVDKKQISLRTFLDQLQQIKNLAVQTPEEEMKLILRDALLFGGKLTEKLQELVASDWDPQLAALLAEIEAGAQGPPQGPPGPGGPPQGPPGPPGMGGMPPGVVAPQAIPPMLGQAQQMGLQGQPPPGPGGVPRGPGG